MLATRSSISSPNSSSLSSPGKLVVEFPGRADGNARAGGGGMEFAAFGLEGGGSTEARFPGKFWAVGRC